MTVLTKARTEAVAEAAYQCYQDPLAWGIALGYNGDARGRKKPALLHRRILDFWTGGQGKTNWRSVVVPRDHGKSTWGGIILTSWRKMRDPWRRTVIAGGDMDLAGKQIGTIRERLMGKIHLAGEDYWLADIFPWMEVVGKRDRATAVCEAFNVVGRTGRGAESCFFSKSPGARQAGDHPTDAHLDDLTTEQSKDSYPRRQNELDFLIGLRPYMAFGHESWVTHAGTPWHYWDTTAFISQSPEWSQLRYGVEDIIEPGADILCPSCLTRDEWEVIKADPQKSDEYRTAQYLCRPAASTQSIFSQQLIEDCTAKEWTIARLFDGRLAKYGCVLAWDPTHRLTGERAKKSSNNGVVVFKPVPNAEIGIKGIDPARNIWFPIGAFENKGGADDTRAWIEHEAIKQFPDLAEIWIEDRVAQAFLAPWLENISALAGIRMMPLECPEGNTSYRLQGAVTAMRKGYVVFPPDFPGRNLLVRQMLEYPAGDLDDVAAAFAMITSQYARYGDILPPEHRRVFQPGLTTWPVPQGRQPDVWSL